MPNFRAAGEGEKARVLALVTSDLLFGIYGDLHSENEALAIVFCNKYCLVFISRSSDLIQYGGIVYSAQQDFHSGY